jgi:predicted dehydrogenase
MIKWGIIGAGKIAHSFARSMSFEEDGEIIACACRTQEKAQAFADEFHIANAYGDFEEVLKNREVEAVYIALPHKLHKEWTIKAMRAQKAVLCEKPLGINEEEIHEIEKVHDSMRVLCMEGMKTRFVPFYPILLEILRKGTLGKLTKIEARFSKVKEIEAGSFHAEAGTGGALLDLGIYCANWLPELCKGEPFVKILESRMKNGVDLYTKAQLTYPDGLIAEVSCGFDREEPCELILTGEKGKMRVSPLNKPDHAVAVITGQDQPQVGSMPYDHDDFWGEIHHFSMLYEARRKQSDVMSLEDSAKVIHVLDLIRDALRS